MKTNYLAALLLGVVIAGSQPCEAAKQPSISELIAASQSGSTNVFFDMNNGKSYDLDIDGYNNPREFNIRRGLPNFFRKCAAGESVNVAYIGGSITKAGEMYRMQSAQYISSMFPDCEMNGINAGIGGTGSSLGACRLYEQVLQYNPDLVFVEFAVNEANQYGVEGIIRQIIKHNPKCDICVIHTIHRYQSEIYASGEIPENIERLERVAEHYNVPSVHMGMWSGDLITSGDMVWDEKLDEAKQSGKKAFTRDGVHPNLYGGNYYASAIVRAFEAMKDHMGNERMKLISPLSEKHLERATVVDPAELNLDSTWRKVKCEGDAKFDPFKYWFTHVYNGDINSTPIKFKFKGKKVGIFDIGAYDGCGINIVVDGRKYVVTKATAPGKPIEWEFVSPDDPRCSINRFIPLCVITYRGQFVLAELDSDGVHEIEISVAPNDSFDKVSIAKQSPRYEEYKDRICEQELHLGRILIEGELVK